MLFIWTRLELCCTVNDYAYLKRQILDSSELKESADDNIKFVENGRKFSKRVEKTLGKE